VWWADVAGVAGYEAPAIDWQPCPDAAGVQCATIEVPLDWREPAGATTHIGLAKRPAKDQANRIGSILVDPGGPGGSGVELVMGEDPFTAKVSARFDVVGFDPRGINTSEQLLCDEDLSQRASAARHPTSHVGYSYGSLMGQQYAELFPDRIRAMVNDGNMDHSLNTAWEFMRTETEPVEKNFLEFADWCDTTATCALNGLDTKAVYGELREKAEAGELTDPNGQPMDFYDLSRMAFTVNRPAQWGQLATDLKTLKDGTGAVSTTAGAAAAAVNNPYPPIWCSDWRYPVADFAEYDELRTGLAKKFPNIQWSPYVDHALTCAGDPLANTNPQRPLEIEGAPPLVMIGNIHDPATVYEWNRTAAKQSGSRLITYEGWGHTAYHGDGPSPCVNDAVDAYLIDLTVPDKGLSCPATEQPGTVTGTADPTPLGPGPYAWMG
jgi:pimeloyl-ACP methyl ester carboxylesterase